jgi:8-oxo-dGTP diphosphatase
MTMLNLYQLVRIVRLNKPPEAYNSWGVNQRPPQVGDTGCLLEILHAPGYPDCYVVEESGPDSNTNWLCDFTRDEIEPVGQRSAEGGLKPGAGARRRGIGPATQLAPVSFSSPGRPCGQLVYARALTRKRDKECAGSSPASTACCRYKQGDGAMRLKRLGAAAVILNAAGHVLLVKHTYGRLNWELPGGYAEADESIIATAIREVREETGLHVRALHTTGTYYDVEHDMHHFVFSCQPLDPAALPQPAADEVSRCAFWPITDLPRPISDFTVRRIMDAVAGAQQPLPQSIEPRQWLE